MRRDHGVIGALALLVLGDLLTQPHQTCAKLLPGVLLFLAEPDLGFQPVFDQ
jgi:hypothetical protein